MNNNMNDHAIRVVTRGGRMTKEPLYPEGHPKRIEHDSQRNNTTTPSPPKKNNKKKRKNGRKNERKRGKKNNKNKTYKCSIFVIFDFYIDNWNK